MRWILSHKYDAEARAIADRHYNRQKPGSPQFVPPGRALVLKREGAFWITSFPFAEYVRHEWAGAWMCSAFRNEGDVLSSELVRDAVAATLWYFGDPPPLGMVTFVDPTKTRAKRDPGRCFRRAGFVEVGRTSSDRPTCRRRPRHRCRGSSPRLQLSFASGFVIFPSAKLDTASVTLTDSKAESPANAGLSWRSGRDSKPRRSRHFASV